MFKLRLRRRCVGRDLGKLFFFWIESPQCPFDRSAVAVFDLRFAQLEALPGRDAFGLDLGGTIGGTYITRPSTRENIIRLP